MKLTRRVTVLGLALLVTLVQARTALAAPGGGSSDFGGGGGGGGGGFGGGGGGGGIWIPGGGGGGGVGGVGAFFVLSLIVLSMGVVAFEQMQIKTGRKDRDAAVYRKVGHGIRAMGPGRKARQERERQVEIAAEEARMHDEAFAPEVVKPSAATLHRDIVDAWTARDRETLRTLLAPDLYTEWALRLDDFDRKGWHNVTELLAEPEVEYLGLVNREDDADDRVVVRVEAHLRDYVRDRHGRIITRTDDSDAETVLAEYWVLGKRGGRWTLLSTEQDAEGGHHIESAIIATPWADDERLLDEAATERGVAGAVADDHVGQLADVDFEGSARIAALDLATLDGRFAPDVIEASVRRAVSGWVEAVDGEDAALEAVTTAEVAAELLHPGDTSRRTRLVVRGPRVHSIHITGLQPETQPPTLTVEVGVEGRRYIQDRDTIAVLRGSKHDAVRFTEHWTLSLDGADETPWRISGTGFGHAAWGTLGSEPDIPDSLREKLRRA